MTPAQRFERVMNEVLRHEGGFVNHPDDPGGATNMGITIGTLAHYRGHAVTVADVQNLTKAEAREIYRQQYWRAVRGDQLPAGLDYVAMDAAVNAGPRRSVRWLQHGLRAAGHTVAVDGRMGSETVNAAQAAAAAGRAPDAIKAACAARLAFKRGLRIWATFGRGWSRRVAEVEAKAIRWAVEATGQLARPALIEQERQARQAERNAQRSASATAVATPAASVGVEQAVDVVSYSYVPVVVIGLVVVIIFAGRVMVQRERAQAFRDEALEGGL